MKDGEMRQETRTEVTPERSTGQASRVISRTSTIGDIVSKHPEVIETLLGLGVHCVGCQVAYWETLEDGLRSHGFEEDRIDDAVKALNGAVDASTAGQVASGVESRTVNPSLADGPLSDGPVITDAASVKIKEFLSKESAAGLKISLIPGGCSGFQYGFELLDAPLPDDLVREANGVKLFLDRETAEFLDRARVDYVENVQGSGFRIVNPKAKVGCGCGKSFSA